MNFQNIIKKQSDEIQSLKSELITFKTRCEQYEQAYESLTHQMAELIRNRFGRKSERYIDPESKQLSLFPEDNGLFACTEDNGKNITRCARALSLCHHIKLNSYKVQSSWRLF